MELEGLNAVEPKAQTEDYLKLQKLLRALEKRELPEEVSTYINGKIQRLNSFSGPSKKHKLQMAKTRLEITKLLEKKLKLVPKRYYMNMWMLLGLSCFGIPIGTVFSFSSENYGLIGVGLPIGMCIGAFVGSTMDKKAQEEGRQLEV